MTIACRSTADGLDACPRWASKHAEKIAAMSFTPDKRRALLDGVNGESCVWPGFEFLRGAKAADNGGCAPRF
jgi:hypothetical protein